MYANLSTFVSLVFSLLTSSAFYNCLIFCDKINPFIAYQCSTYHIGFNTLLQVIWHFVFMFTAAVDRDVTQHLLHPNSYLWYASLPSFIPLSIFSFLGVRQWSFYDISINFLLHFHVDVTVASWSSLTSVTLYHVLHPLRYGFFFVFHLLQICRSTVLESKSE